MSYIVIGVYSNFQKLNNSVHPEDKLDTRLYFCPRCNDYRPSEYYQVNPWAHICFIPVFPLCQKKKMLVCKLCEVEVDKENFIDDRGKVEVPGIIASPMMLYTPPPTEKQ